MFTRIRTHPIRTAIGGAGIAAACAVALSPAAGQAASKTQTLRVYDVPQQILVTQADGTVVDRPPYPDSVPGDQLDVYSLDYAGNHSKHSKKPIGSSHLHCVFVAADAPPACESNVELGDGLLYFKGDNIVAGTRRYEGASGKVLKNKTVSEEKNDSDIVVRIKRR